MRRTMAVVIIMALLLPSLAAADVQVLKKGQPAPYDGLLLDEAASVKAAVAAEDLEFADRLIEALKKSVEGKDAEIASLRTVIAELSAQNRANEIALARAEGRDEARKEIIGLYAGQLERSEKQIERLERRLFWERILGALSIIGVAAGFFLVK